jgi:curved DNA-binding protein CbpA
MFDTIKKNAQQAKYQNAHTQSDLHEITRAKEILEITAPTLSEEIIQQAFRIKIKEFHPDLYQTLPEAVRTLLETKAQEINQARAVLLAFIK